MKQWKTALLPPLVILALAGFSGESRGDRANVNTPATPEARSYTVLDQQDFSAGYGRTRKVMCIASDAESFTSRSHTIIRAALDFQSDTGADYVQVEMTPIEAVGCDDYHAAIAEYSPDGGGATGDEENHFWQVMAADVVLDIEERLVLIAWQEAKDDFETGGEIDTEGLKQHVARQLNLSPEQVEEFYLRGVEMGMTMRPYPVE